MPGVGIDQEDSVRQILDQPERVRNGNHVVMDAVDDERRVMDALEVGEALARKPLPVAKCSQLRRGYLRSRRRIEILPALRQPSNEGLARSLARLRRREEDPSSGWRIPEASGR